MNSDQHRATIPPQEPYRFDIMNRERLEEGDIITVFNPLLKNREYPVLSIDGNRAETKFRTFNTRIYNGQYVYEFGQRLSPIYNNTYTVTPHE